MPPLELELLELELEDDELLELELELEELDDDELELLELDEELELLELDDELELLEDELELDEELELLELELVEPFPPCATQLNIVPVELSPLPCIPKLAEPPGARLPFQLIFVAV